MQYHASPAPLVLPTVPRSLAEIDLDALLPHSGVHPSPRRWNDQVCYFLLPDRFSDGRENERELYSKERASDFALNEDEKKAWLQSSMRWQGGNLRGIMSHLPYLKELGVTTLWIGPIFKQRKDEPTYHGYAIQNFLDVDPHIGTREELVELVKMAHSLGMYVLMDVIFNHTGDNFFYKHKGKMVSTMAYTEDRHAFGAWKDEHGKPSPDIKSIEDGVWPKEFQDPEWYFRAGSINNWDKYPEYVRGDFMTLKALNLNRNDTMSALIQVYRYWIALTDCDGFRIDTVKHVPLAAAQRFCRGIHEFAHFIGKDRFLLVGEVSGSAPMRVRFLGGGLPLAHNLDAVLDIGEQSKRLCGLFNTTEKTDVQLAFLAKDDMENLREVGFQHFTILDDHDMIWQHAEKARVGHINDGPNCEKRVAHLTGVQLTLPGIPCIYYGTEQAFTGHGDGDKYLRENLFGGDFGAFGTRGCHFFDSQHPTYRRIAAIARLRNSNNAVGLALRHGRLYLRDIVHIAFSTNAQKRQSENQKGNSQENEAIPKIDPDPQPRKLSKSQLRRMKLQNRSRSETELMSAEDLFKIDERLRRWRHSRRGEVLAWSRIYYNTEVLIVLNTHPSEERRALVTIDRYLQEIRQDAKLRRASPADASPTEPEMCMEVLYSGEWSGPQLDSVGKTTSSMTKEYLPAMRQKDGRHFVSISLAPAGMMILH